MDNPDYITEKEEIILNQYLTTLIPAMMQMQLLQGIEPLSEEDEIRVRDDFLGQRESITENSQIAASNYYTRGANRLGLEAATKFCREQIILNRDKKLYPQNNDSIAE